MISISDSIKSLSGKHRKTLREVLRSPGPSQLEWRRIEALFIALGAAAFVLGAFRLPTEVALVVSIVTVS